MAPIISEPSSDDGATVNPSSKLKCTYGEVEFLEDALKGFTSFTAKKLLALDDFCLVRYSLLLLSEIVWMGGLEPDSEEFAGLLSAFCDRAMTSRPLKLRVVLLTNTADLGLRELWNSTVLYDPTCYNHAEGEKSSPECDPLVTDGNSLRNESDRSNFARNEKKTILKVDARDLLKDDQQLKDYVTNRFFNPNHGIQLRRNGGWWNCSQAKNVFSERSALLFLMQDLNSTKATASGIKSRMEQLNLIERVKGRCLPRNFRYGLTKYVRGSLSIPSLNKKPSVVAEFSQRDEDKKGIDISFGMDLLDLQSIKFWTETIWDKEPVKGIEFGPHAVVHPMAVASKMESAAAEFSNRSRRSLLSQEKQLGEASALSCGGYIVHNIEVKKVFSSMAKPAILSLSAFKPGCIVRPFEQVERSILEIMPQVIEKKGDNLIQDMSVSLIFSVFNHVWRTDANRFGGEEKVPFSFSYDVLPTGAKKGLLEVVTGVEPLNNYDWVNWVKKNKHNEEVLANMLRSTAGCSVAQYVLGCGDRHFDNIQIKDGETMLHIDFGMILGDNPPFKTPRFSISGDMEKSFRDVGIWKPFLDLCAGAFLSLRARSNELTRIIVLLLKLSSRSRDKILTYLASEESFNIDESSEESAVRLVCKRIEESSTSWETIMRKFTHDNIDPLFFKAAGMAPKPVVEAVESWYER